MSKTNERTLKMMEGFIPMHERGLTVSEIAKKFKLSETTVYSKLSVIAERAGVSRESLLQKPIQADHSGRNFTPVKPVDAEKFNKEFDATMSGLENLRKIIAETIEEHEIIIDLLLEECV